MTAADRYFEFLADAVVSGSVTNFTVTFQARDLLYVECNSTGSSAISDSLMIRFNGDSGSNYNYRNIWYAGSTTAIDDNGVSATLINATGQSAAASCPQTARFFVSNILANNKILVGCGGMGAGAVATAVNSCLGGRGVWYNTTSVITSIVMQNRGAGNFTAGSSIRVFGRNFV